MSFQIENPHLQPKNKAFASANLLGDHHHHLHLDDGGVLVSRVIPITLDLFHINQSPPPLNLQHPCPLFARDPSLHSKSKPKSSWEDHTSEETMSRRNGNNNNNNMPKLDLKLNLSPPSSRMRGANPRTESPSRSASVSPPSSCVSSDVSMSSPESSSMVLVGCPRCLMYVMLSEDDPKCPKCKSTVLLDFVHDNNNNNNNSNNTNNNANCNYSGSSKKTRKN